MRKNYRWFLLFPVMLLLALVLAAPALAGGWAVITLDRLPERLTAGESYSIGFMTRQHGQTPWEVSEIRIEAKQAETGQTVAFEAHPDQTPGHYTVELVFPQPGRWEWGIKSGLYPTLQPMPALQVSAASPAPARETASGWPMGLTGSAALAALAIAATLILHRRRLVSVYLVGISLLLGAGLLVFGLVSNANAQKENPATMLSPITSDAETGQKLFLAKGCVVCHTNQRAIQASETYGVNAGPNLSVYQKDPAFLRQFLTNPTGPQTSSMMPNLGLAPAEIEALVKFINDDAIRPITAP